MKVASEKLLSSARKAMKDVLGLRKGERVLVVTNPERDVLSISNAVYAAAEATGGNPCIVVQPRKRSIDFASDEVIYALRSEPEIIISISSEKLGRDRFGLEKPYRFKGVKGSWNHIFHALLGAGKSRGFWSPSVTMDMFKRTVDVDYREMKRRCRKLSRLLDKAAEAVITSSPGTDITIPLKGRKAFPDDGSFRKPGEGGNLPAGEVYISPENYSAEGIIVFDGSISVVGGEGTVLPVKTVIVEVRKGLVERIRGGVEARRLEESLRRGEESAGKMKGRRGWTKERIEEFKKNARHLGELGIGLNPRARMKGNMLEDEKVLGTCHIAIGANYDRDAEAFIHLDCLIRKPTLVVKDGKGRKTTIIENGRLAIP